MLNISYKKIIDKSPVGYALHEIICNSKGQPCDYILIEANAAFEAYTGLKISDIHGKRISEILPYIKKDSFDWISFYGNIALNGGEKEFQQYSGVLGRWFTVNAYSPEKNYFITFFTDISEHIKKQSDIQELLYEISRDFVNVKTENIDQAISDSLEKLGNTIEADRVYIFRYDFDRNICSNIYEWCSEGTAPRINALLEISLDLIPEWVERHISGNPLFVNGETDLEYIKERKHLRLDEIKSLIAVPIIYDHKLYGFAGFNSIKNTHLYSSLEHNLLQNFSQLLLSIMLRKEMEDSVYLKKEIFRTTLLSIADGVVSVDVDENIILMNEAAEKLCGISYKEAQGRPIKSIFNFIDSDSKKPYENTVDNVIRTGLPEKISGNLSLISRDGREIPVQYSASAVKNKKMQKKGAVIVIRDATSERNIQKQAEYLSFHDHLTKLYNRRFFEEELLRLDTLRNLPISFILMDVNGLKLTNDAFGHEMGDQLLKKIADVIKKECRNDDIVARLGGDEFAAILPKTDIEQARLIMDRISNSAARENLNNVVVSLAVGCSSKTSPDQNVDETMNIAENNMYSNKISSGKNMRKMTFERIVDNLFKKYKNEIEQTSAMVELSKKIGTAMNFSQDQLSNLEIAARYHDIGKIIISPQLLNKKRGLTLEEYDIVQRHSEAGYQIMKSQEEYSSIAIYILSHHEKWDGSGYPRNHKGHEIPLFSRILAIADAYTAMTCNSPYRTKLSKDEAVKEIMDNSGLQFDPEIVDIFLDIVLHEDL